jgi:hypothetical protein
MVYGRGVAMKFLKIRRDVPALRQHAAVPARRCDVSPDATSEYS